MVLILSETYKGAWYSHIRQKKCRKPPKMMKITKFLEYLEYQGIFWKKHFL